METGVDMIKILACAASISVFSLFISNTFIGNVTLSCIYILKERYSKKKNDGNNNRKS
jgi:hypothetical protein